MNDETDAWWRLHQEYSSEARHHEQQRASVTGFFSALAAAILSVIGIDKALTLPDLPLTMFLLMLGTFGALFSAKQYERWFVCMERARQYRRALDTALANARIIEFKRLADQRARERFPRLHAWHLGRFWVALHLFIALFGLLLTGIIVVRELNELRG